MVFVYCNILHTTLDSFSTYTSKSNSTTPSPSAPSPFFCSEPSTLSLPITLEKLKFQSVVPVPLSHCPFFKCSLGFSSHLSRAASPLPPPVLCAYFHGMHVSPIRRPAQEQYSEVLCTCAPGQAGFQCSSFGRSRAPPKLEIRGAQYLFRPMSLSCGEVTLVRMVWNADNTSTDNGLRRRTSITTVALVAVNQRLEGSLQFQMHHARACMPIDNEGYAFLMMGRTTCSTRR